MCCRGLLTQTLEVLPALAPAAIPAVPAAFTPLPPLLSRSCAAATTTSTQCSRGPGTSSSCWPQTRGFSLSRVSGPPWLAGCAMCAACLACACLAVRLMCWTATNGLCLLPPCRCHCPAAAAADVVWEQLVSVDGDTQLVGGDFRPFQPHASQQEAQERQAAAQDAEWAVAAAAAAAAGEEAPWAWGEIALSACTLAWSSL